MNWKERVLFYMKSSNGLISRRSMEPILMKGCTDYESSVERLKVLLDEKVIERIESDQFSFKLTDKGDSTISSFFMSAEGFMKSVFERLSNLLSGIDEIELKGGTTGVYFTYTNRLHMFRFHPEEHKGELLLRVRLPNLIGEAIGYKSNEIYISQDILEKTRILEDLVKAHIDMIDKYESHRA